MARTRPRTLFDKLLKHYGSALTLKSDHTYHLHVDDQSDQDAPSLFCSICLTLNHSTDSTFLLEMWNVPFDRGVEIAAADLGGGWKQLPAGKFLSFKASPENATEIRRLARAIRDVAGPGKSYSDSNWKWITRRTAGSLERLAKCLGGTERPETTVSLIFNSQESLA